MISRLHLPCLAGLLAGTFLHTASAGPLTLREDAATHTLSVFRDGVAAPILTQNARPDFRPYLHPIVAPDGKGVLTEFSPGHHKHQTGLYWGFTSVNGRDYFHNPDNNYWRRVSSELVIARGAEVKWSTVYHLLDAAGEPIMAETQLWTMHDSGDRYLLDLEWKGEALIDLTFAKKDYGGLFLRMPWRAGMVGAAINSNRQSNDRADTQRAIWVDLGLKLEGRTDLAHIAIFDHPQNAGYPQPWRIDRQLGVGPSRSILGDWTLAKGKTEIIRHQFVVYSGPLNDVALTEAWKAYTGEASDSVLWGLAKSESKQAVFLTGEQAVAKMTVPPGLEVKLAASEPMITQPMAFCWDDRGRMWVAENRDYETRRTGFSNSGDSRILILEDTDGDGKFDKRTVFMEGIPFPAAIAVGFGGLWLGAPPNLLFVPDRNHDDQADSAIENPSLLTACDWWNVFVDQQGQVRRGELKNGVWHLEVAAAGDYEIELRRWPREADLPLAAAAPAAKLTDGDLPAGAALPIARARIKIGATDESLPLAPESRHATYRVRLPAGPAELQTWFLRTDGSEVCGAYYVYVKKI